MVAMFAGLVGATLVPLALSAPVAWLMLGPALGMFVSLACTGATLDGLAGRPEHARRWGLAAVVVVGLTCGALEVGSMLRGEGLGYWSGPWLCALGVGWLPPLVAGTMGAVGERRRRQLHVRVVRARRAARQPNSES